MKTGVRAIAIVVICLVALSGCSASSSYPKPPATPSIAYPTTGGSLASAGYANAVAADIWLPSGTVLTYTANQPNLIIASGKLEQAALVEAYLRETLPGLGWDITSQADGGLLFRRGEWQGGYAQGTTTWALTVRND